MTPTVSGFIRGADGRTAAWSASWTVTEPGDPQLAPGYVPPNLATANTAGLADARAGIQAILNAGGRVRIPAGEHRCSGPLELDAGAVIYLEPGARLLKNFSASGAVKSSFIQNRTWGNNGPAAVTQVPDVWIGGPGELSAVSQAMGGNLLGLYGDRIKLVDFTTTAWDGGRHTVLAGDDCRAVRCHWTGGMGRTGNGGLRFQGGKRFIGEDLYCESGDDVFQFVPAGASADPTYGLGIEDSVYRNCTGMSSHAKLVVIGLQEGGSSGPADGVVTMPASAGVWRSGFANCNAPGGTAVTARIQNISSAGPIVDCYLDGVSTQGLETPTGGVELLVNAWQDTGGITRLTLRDVTMLPIRQPTAMMRGGVDVVYEDCHITRGSDAPGDSVARAAGTRTIYRRCTFDGLNRAAPVVTVEAPENGGGPNPTGVRFEECHFGNVNGTGVQLQAGTGTALEGCTFEGTGQAVRVTGGAQPELVDNDYGGLTAPSF